MSQGRLQKTQARRKPFNDVFPKETKQTPLGKQKLHNGSNAYLDFLTEAKSCFLNTVGSLVITWCFWRRVPSCCPQLTARPRLDEFAGGDSRFCGSVPSCRLISSGGRSEPPPAGSPAGLLLAAASLSLPRLRPSHLSCPFWPRVFLPGLLVAWAALAESLAQS